MNDLISLGPGFFPPNFLKCHRPEKQDNLKPWHDMKSKHQNQWSREIKKTRFLKESFSSHKSLRVGIVCHFESKFRLKMKNGNWVMPPKNPATLQMCQERCSHILHYILLHECQEVKRFFFLPVRMRLFLKFEKISPLLRILLKTCHHHITHILKVKSLSK